MRRHPTKLAKKQQQVNKQLSKIIRLHKSFKCWVKCYYRKSFYCWRLTAGSRRKSWLVKLYREGTSQKVHRAYLDVGQFFHWRGLGSSWRSSSLVDVNSCVGHAGRLEVMKFTGDLCRRLLLGLGAGESPTTWPEVIFFIYIDISGKSNHLKYMVWDAVVELGDIQDDWWLQCLPQSTEVGDVGGYLNA